jgi:pimeloyl-ACP methyl ester carboxylesterase
MKGAPAPGPAQYDRLWVKQLGPERHSRVIVLMPGTNGGAGSILPVAHDLVRRLRRTQVWIVDRRQQAFEDTSVFATRDPVRAFDYYLGFRYRRVASEDVPFVAEWGLKTQLNDLRRVVRRAARGGREVILGGHSAGASMAVAYAAWDFGGRPGYRDVEKLVLIDGGLLGSFDSADLARARRELAALRDGSRNRFLDQLGLGLPEINGIFAQTAALLAYERPEEPSVLQTYPLLPDFLKPPVRVTNEAALGYAFDQTTASDDLGSIQLRAGRLADSGDPRPWQDGELTSLRRFSRFWSMTRPDPTEWYYPYRLLLDIDAASPLRQNAAARHLGLRLLHGSDIDVPVYAYSTELSRGRVARGARRLERRSRVPRAVVVDDRRANHLDPLSASPSRNRFLKTVLPFLRSR